MVVIKSVDAKSVFDSRGEKTIEVSVKTNSGNFSASAPNGKSKGKHEAKPYKIDLDDDIKTLKRFTDYFSDEKIGEFDDLKRIEDTVNGHVGANTLFALESAILKALAKEQKKEIWELINENAKKFPRLAGNCIGGGKHSGNEKKPDFQEFLLIPNFKSVKENFESIKKAKETLHEELRESDEKFKGIKNDEDAWETSLNEKEVLEILKKLKIPLGIDVASSSFYKRRFYIYKNPLLKRDREEQLKYISNLMSNFSILYLEDPFGEDDFEYFSKLLEKFPDRLIVGDDLTTTNLKRLERAIEKKSVNALIVKPNQTGSLIEVKKICELA